MMITDSLFALLDLNNDGKISRSELHEAARQLGWHWHEAPILAVLDLLTLCEPMPQEQFSIIMQQIQEDPLGPYGKVLLNSPHFYRADLPGTEQLSPHALTSINTFPNDKLFCHQNGEFENDLIAAIEDTAGKTAASVYQGLLEAFDTYPISVGQAALLIIDPQRSFTKGAWMQSIGDAAAIDVKPIVIAFNNCANILTSIYGRMEIMFSRCPFPPGSYAWDERLAAIIDHRQLYFIKPGNSIMFPPLNGFKKWITRCLDQGIHTLIVGGCTLNSCVRVSSIDVQQIFNNRDLKVVVDLSMCGARLCNYVPSSRFKGLSAVASAVSQMTTAGVRVTRQVEFTL
jgi:hypothetical protein